MSLNLNKVMLAGGVVRDPEVRISQQGDKSMAIARLTLGVSRPFKKKDEQYPENDYITIVCFGKTAEFIEKSVKKGTKLYVEGSWRSGSYTNKDGQKVYTNELYADTVHFVDSAPAGNGNGGSSAAGNGGSGYAPAGNSASEPEDNGSDVGDFGEPDAYCPW